MSKYRRREKRWKAVRMLIVYAIIQILLIGCGCFVLYDTRIATEAKTEQITLIPDRVEIVEGISIGRHTQANSHTYLYADGVRYACAERLYQYDMGDVRDLDGKTLRVRKTSDNIIVELACGDTSYYTMEDYNTHQIIERIVGVLIWSFVELVFVCVSVVCWFVYGNGRYIDLRIKRKKSAEKKRGN